jgi:hypothetical protein
MNKTQIYKKISELYKRFRSREIEDNLFAKEIETLIITNIDIVPELEELADALALFHEPKDDPSLLGRNELIKLICSKYPKLKG